MQELKIIIETFGFPIACCIAMGIFIWKMYTKMSLTLDKVTETNAELVMTNSSLMKNIDTKMDKIEGKLDKVIANGVK